MQTKIPLPYYYKQDVFQKELESIFQDSWQLVGFIHDLQNHNDYITATIAGIAVVVRNINGTLKAFQNVCSHRFNKICSNKKGNGYFRCQYHGWAYDEDGIPKGIPDCTGFTRIDYEKLKLKQYAVECCGAMVFIRLKDNGVGLQRFLGDLFPEICAIGNALGEKIDTNELIIKSNWKVAVENTLEEYHVKAVHPESFSKIGITKSTYKMLGHHSTAMMTVDSSLSKNPRFQRSFSDRPIVIDGYKHFLIFPNMTVASAFGTTFSIQQIMPLTEVSHLFISHVFATKLPSGLSTPLQRSLNLHAVDFNRQVFNEDKDVCETVQHGMEHTDRESGPLHAKEARVLNFQESYMKEMS